MSNLMSWWQMLLVVTAIVLVLLWLLLRLPFYLLYRVVLRIAVELLWGIRGKRILLVYSRSPHWQQYIESTWLPRIESHATVLNWSDRLLWARQHHLASLVFSHWKPEHNFNPMVILFPPWRPVQRIGFYNAFRDFKHGKESKLRDAETQLFRFADSLESKTA